MPNRCGSYKGCSSYRHPAIVKTGDSVSRTPLGGIHGYRQIGASRKAQFAPSQCVDTSAGRRTPPLLNLHHDKHIRPAPPHQHFPCRPPTLAGGPRRPARTPPRAPAAQAHRPCARQGALLSCALPGRKQALPGRKQAHPGRKQAHPVRPTPQRTPALSQ